MKKVFIILFFFSLYSNIYASLCENEYAIIEYVGKEYSLSQKHLYLLNIIGENYKVLGYHDINGVSQECSYTGYSNMKKLGIFSYNISAYIKILGLMMILVHIVFYFKKSKHKK